MSFNTALSLTEKVSLLSVSASCIAVLANIFGEHDAPLLSSLAFSGIAFAATFCLIRWLGNAFITVGLQGADMSKVRRVKLPEAMGIVCAVVYVWTLSFFIPFSFYKDIVEATSGGGNRDVVEAVHQVETGSPLHRFPHSRMISYLSAIVSIQGMLLLGIADDIGDVRWRHKIPMPAIAAIPLLLTYFSDFGVTSVVVPLPLRPYLGELIDLKWWYYVYMVAVVTFCPNSINILAGVNGLEVSQSIVIAVLLLINDFLYLEPITKYPHPATDSHLFSIYLLLPFIGVSMALWWHNWYPAKVFVGDTYCYFAGMVFAVVGILGHFSKTLMLLFVPQIINFLYSSPQLFHIIPCPRHRMPKFNARSGLMEVSVTEWQKPPEKLVATTIKLLAKFWLIRVKFNDQGDIIETSNMTVLNLWLFWFGPMREDRLTIGIVAAQFFCGLMGLVVRHKMALLVFEQDNRSFKL